MFLNQKPLLSVQRVIVKQLNEVELQTTNNCCSLEGVLKGPSVLAEAAWTTPPMRSLSSAVTDKERGCVGVC